LSISQAERNIETEKRRNKANAAPNRNAPNVRGARLPEPDYDAGCDQKKMSKSGTREAVKKKTVQKGRKRGTNFTGMRPEKVGGGVRRRVV